jgi:cell division protein FtsL
MEENSISIINRTNGQLTGEHAQALPVQIKANFSWVKIFLIGFAAAIILMILFIAYVRQQVTVIETTGVAPNYQEYQIK